MKRDTLARRCKQCGRIAKFSPVKYSTHDGRPLYRAHCNSCQYAKVYKTDAQKTKYKFLDIAWYIEGSDAKITDIIKAFDALEKHGGQLWKVTSGKKKLVYDMKCER